MRNILQTIAILTLLFLFATNTNMVFARKNTEKFILVIDPGHGGNDLGATGRRSHEKDLTLKIAKRAAKLIRRHTKNTIVILTREKDEYVSLEERAGMANFFHADLFLSIHTNSARTLAQGTESFVHRKRSSSWSKYFATLLQIEYTYNAKRQNRGGETGQFFRITRDEHAGGADRSRFYLACPRRKIYEISARLQEAGQLHLPGIYTIQRNL